MFPKKFKLINSTNKKDIRFVAMGNCQIEFFTESGKEYLAVYRFMGDNNKYMVVDLLSANISQSGDGFQVLDGADRYNINLKNTDNGEYKVRISHKKWGWLPYQRFSGKVSSAGFKLFVAELKSKVNSIE